MFFRPSDYYFLLIVLCRRPLRLVLGLALLGFFASSGNGFLNLVHLSPRNAESHYNAGLRLASQGKDADAYKALDRAIADPKAGAAVKIRSHMAKAALIRREIEAYTSGDLGRRLAALPPAYSSALQKSIASAREKARVELETARTISRQMNGNACLQAVERATGTKEWKGIIEAGTECR